MSVILSIIISSKICSLASAGRQVSPWPQGPFLPAARSNLAGSRDSSWEIFLSGGQSALVASRPRQGLPLNCGQRGDAGCLPVAAGEDGCRTQATFLPTRLLPRRGRRPQWAKPPARRYTSARQNVPKAGGTMRRCRDHATALRPGAQPRCSRSTSAA